MFIDKVSKRSLCLALYTASQWHGDRGAGPVAMLQLSSTRRVHSEEHRSVLRTEIKNNIQELMTNFSYEEHYNGFADWKMDIDRLLDLFHIVTECPVGTEWLGFAENDRIHDSLYQANQLR